MSANGLDDDAPGPGTAENPPNAGPGQPPPASAPGQPPPAGTPGQPAVVASDDAVEQVNTRAIFWTMFVSAFFAVAANAALLVNYMHDRNNGEGADWNMPWQAPVAMALSIVSIVSFGGFYIAARRARIAIAASFLLTFLVMLPFSLTIPGLGSGSQTDLAKALADQFGSVVSTVIVFYFGSEAVITGIKLWTTSQNPQAAGLIARADRDLPPKNAPTTAGLVAQTPSSVP